jgi:hypothetical protein
MGAHSFRTGTDQERQQRLELQAVRSPPPERPVSAPRRHPKRSGGASARHSTQPNPARRRMTAPGQPRSSSRWIQQSLERVYPPRWRGRNQGWCSVRSSLEGEHIINNIRGLFALEPADAGDCCRSIFVLLFSPVFTCFPHSKSWNLNDLVLISFCVARAAPAYCDRMRRAPQARVCGTGRNFFNAMIDARSARHWSGLSITGEPSGTSPA